MYLEEMEWDRMDWIHMVQDTLAVKQNSVNRHIS
jgi:hypothetical protein